MSNDCFRCFLITFYLSSFDWCLFLVNLILRIEVWLFEEVGVPGDLVGRVVGDGLRRV